MTRSILIVAAERGLGLGLAEEFLRRGWTVTGTARPGADTAALEHLRIEWSRSARRDALPSTSRSAAPDPEGSGSAPEAIRATGPARLSIERIDVSDAHAIEDFLERLGDGRFDVIFFNAGIWGAPHQSAAQATDAEFADIMLTNCFGPIRLAHRLVDRLAAAGTFCFMSSHRGSVALNVEGGLELYRASKVALNMLARGLWAANRDRALTVLSIHPGWVATAMGTLGGTVAAEMEIKPSVRGVANVVERHRGSGDNLYRDWQDRALDW